MAGNDKPGEETSPYNRYEAIITSAIKKTLR
jgi:hypothetical protein